MIAKRFYPQMLRFLGERLLILLPLILAACASPGAPTVQVTAPAQATNTAAPTSTVAAELPSTGGTAQAVTPSVTVEDQAIEGGMVVISEVVSAGPGWLVIHAQNGDAPGPVIGFAPVEDGVNTDVMVEIDQSQATDTLYAMLHVDAGQVGVYEFPGDDGPATVDGQVVTPPFNVSNAAGSTATPKAEETAPAASASEFISMEDNEFSPVELTISVGTTVRWTNNDGSVPHTVTADDGSFDSGNMDGGDTFQFTFDEPGTYPYFCGYHGGPGGAGMAGTIIVQ